AFHSRAGASGAGGRWAARHARGGGGGGGGSGRAAGGGSGRRRRRAACTAASRPPPLRRRAQPSRCPRIDPVHGVTTATALAEHRRSVAMTANAAAATARLTHLQQLEAESIYILREAVAESDNPGLLYSIGT